VVVREFCSDTSARDTRHGTRLTRPQEGDTARTAHGHGREEVGELRALVDQVFMDLGQVAALLQSGHILIIRQENDDVLLAGSRRCGQTGQQRDLGDQQETASGFHIWLRASGDGLQEMTLPRVLSVGDAGEFQARNICAAMISMAPLLRRLGAPLHTLLCRPLRHPLERPPNYCMPSDFIHSGPSEHEQQCRAADAAGT
jgi:hypothetical protein